MALMTTWIDVLEAAYDVDSSEEQWLHGVARASSAILDEGFGLFAFTYDASVPEQLRIEQYARTSDAVFDADTALMGIKAAGGDRYGEFVRKTFRSLPVETARNSLGITGTSADQIFADGVGDLVIVNGVDPSGVGMLMGAVTRKPVKLTSAQRDRYGRVGAHLANSYRLRRRLAAAKTGAKAAPEADAVLSPRGRIEHCGDEEVQGAREQLRDAAVAIDRARGRMRRIEPDSALGTWLGLVDGRWSLVDKFDTDGKRFVVARRNEPRVGGLDLLTQRERAVAGYAALGHSNKLIAYELGIAHATVRVLLARASRKLGVRSRTELVDVVRAADDAPKEK